MSKNNQPIVTVLMPVYNAGEFLDEAIESIVNQTYKDFEFLIINDGSTDKSLATIKKYASQDERIKVISRANKGLVATLNEGITKAQGEYIARMDSDDVSLPTRLEKQLKYLVDNPGCVLLGSWGQKIDAKGLRGGTMICPTTNYSTRLIMALHCPYVHGSVIFKKSYFSDLAYRVPSWPAEDYDLWARAAIKDSSVELANLSEVLYLYRETDGNISNQNREAQIKATDKIAANYRNKLIEGGYKVQPLLQRRQLRLIKNNRTEVTQELTRLYYSAEMLVLAWLLKRSFIISFWGLVKFSLFSTLLFSRNSRQLYREFGAFYIPELKRYFRDRNG